MESNSRKRIKRETTERKVCSRLTKLVVSAGVCVGLIFFLPFLFSAVYFYAADHSKLTFSDNNFS